MLEPRLFVKRWQRSPPWYLHTQIKLKQDQTPYRWNGVAWLSPGEMIFYMCINAYPSLSAMRPGWRPSTCVHVNSPEVMLGSRVNIFIWNGRVHINISTFTTVLITGSTAFICLDLSHVRKHLTPPVKECFLEVKTRRTKEINHVFHTRQKIQIFAAHHPLVFSLPTRTNARARINHNISTNHSSQLTPIKAEPFSRHSENKGVRHCICVTSAASQDQSAPMGGGAEGFRVPTTQWSQMK